MQTNSDQAPTPRKRDPEKRKQEILAAAAEIAIDHGIAALTHRAVSAKGQIPLGTITRHFAAIDDLRDATLQKLGQEIDESLAEIETEVTATNNLTQTLTNLMHDFLLDSRQVGSMMAMINAATTDPQLRALATHWTNRLVQILSKQTTTERSKALEIYLNGTVTNAALNDKPVTKKELIFVITAILEAK